MKSEQTIQRSKKSVAGIIGQTCQVSYLTQWKLIYRVVLMISNVYQNITSAALSFGETYLHDELELLYTKQGKPLALSLCG